MSNMSDVPSSLSLSLFSPIELDAKWMLGNEDLGPEPKSSRLMLKGSKLSSLELATVLDTSESESDPESEEAVPEVISEVSSQVV